MKTLILGASGATGKRLTAELLKAGRHVKVIVRAGANIPESWRSNQNLSIVTANVAELTVDEMAAHINDCRAVASCLGHNLTLKGIYGKPRRLVTGAVMLVCEAVKKNAPEKPVRFVLMNTTGVRNRDLNERISAGHKIVIGLLRLLLPPQADNEAAAGFLRLEAAQRCHLLGWVAVRPDTLTDEDEVTGYEVCPSPVRSPIFNPGKTSRINVGNFMARLIMEDALWEKWKGKMPVIYNRDAV